MQDWFHSAAFVPAVSLMTITNIYWSYPFFSFFSELYKDLQDVCSTDTERLWHKMVCLVPQAAQHQQKQVTQSHNLFLLLR